MKHFLLYALCLLLLSLHAKAAVVYSGLQDIAIPTDFNGIFIDIDNGAASGVDFVGADINPFFGGSGFINNAAFQPARTSSVMDSAIIQLPAGAIISSSLNYATGSNESGFLNSHMGAGVSQFTPDVEAFIGFMFTKNDFSGPFFGWMRVVFTNATPGGQIRDWAYDDTGASIAAGAPEPARVLFFLIGLVSIGLRRRR